MVPDHVESKKPTESASSDPSTLVAASPACALPSTPAPSSTEKDGCRMETMDDKERDKDEKRLVENE
ncbi:hypothetical protein scyTo_0023312, partial [Scyliorhinus torazame]|nr:hypothetical protein [Scyliorhinus torazame]